MSEMDTLATSWPKTCQKWTSWLFRGQIQVKTDIFVILWPITFQKRTLGRFVNQMFVKNGHLGGPWSFRGKNTSKMDTVGASRPKPSSKTDTLAASWPKTCRKRTLWRSLAISRQKHVKNGHRGRFAAQTLLKNGHLGRFAAKNMSKTDTLVVLGRFAAKTHQNGHRGRFAAQTFLKNGHLSLRDQNHVQNGHIGRFAAKTNLKNGHFGRFAATNMSKTDTLVVLGRFAAKTDKMDTAAASQPTPSSKTDSIFVAFVVVIDRGRT